LSVALDVTEHIKPPRAVFLPFMMGHLFGVPFHKRLQREIITTALERIERAEKSGDVYFFPKTWAQARKEGKEIERNLAKKLD
jgi:predicted PP-loop superfamily ATPase